MQNLLYALIQSLHNIGAAAIIGLAATALWQPQSGQRLAAWIAAVWVLQGMSGLMFGITTYSYEGHLPDIHGIAVYALTIKIICVISSIVLSLLLYAKKGWDAALLIWRILFVLGIIALAAAAFLRWFS
jgi:hypothetical protein